MKVMIAYPPLDDRRGCPTLGQNRQFQYFKEPTFIYPVVPAQAATLLKAAAHEAVWLDCIAGGISFASFLEKIREEKPDLIAFETKTPVVKQHWKIIDSVKCQVPGVKCVLFGDHVTALPEESLQNSQVDFVLTGGDYDFLLLNLCNALEKSRQQGGPAEGLEPGIYMRSDGQVRNTGAFRLDHDLDSLPFIDRELTHWRAYAYKNGNYKRTPGTYIMSGRDCWYHACTFCSWPTLYPRFRNRRPERVLDEIGELISRYHIREIMDDTGSFPVGEWLRAFCLGMVERGYHRKIYLDCNMRFGILREEDYQMMKNANFRLLLFGLESASQKTLDRINKGVKVEDIINGCRLARKAGLFPHITIMFGYPWETFDEAAATFALGKWLLRKGYAYTMQATLVIPYPGSPLFEEAKSAGWLRTEDWDDYDMKRPVMQSAIPDERVKALIQGMYRVPLEPGFIARKLFSMRDMDDLSYALRAARKVFGHIFDFKSRDASLK